MISLRPAISTQQMMLIFPSKYWISTNCDNRKKHVADQKALSKVEMIKFLLLKKIVFQEIRRILDIDEKNKMADGMP